MFFENRYAPSFTFKTNNKIYMEEKVLDSKTCEDLVEYGLQYANKGVNRFPNLFQVSFQACLLPLNHDVHYKLQNTWFKIKEFFNVDFDFIEPYELKKYNSGDFFGRHSDNFYDVDINLDRKLTMIIQLSNSNDYANGNIMINKRSFRPNRGTVICFPSFFQHEILKIESGTRWSLIGWAWGPYWK